MAYYGFKPAEQAIQVGDNTIVSADIVDGVIVNADINASAAIALSKTQLVAGTGITLATNTLNVDAAQTQITSVGTLTSLATSGNVSLDNSGSLTRMTIENNTESNILFTLGGANKGQLYADSNGISIRSESSVPLLFKTNGNTTALTVGTDQSATFSGSVQISHGTTPDFTLNDTGGTTNKRVFRISGGGDGIYFQGRNNGNTGDGAVGSIMTLSLSDASTTFAGNLTVNGTGSDIITGDYLYLDAADNSNAKNLVFRKLDDTWIGQIEFHPSSTAQIVTRVAQPLALGANNIQILKLRHETNQWGAEITSQSPYGLHVHTTGTSSGHDALKVSRHDDAVIFQVFADAPTINKNDLTVQGGNLNLPQSGKINIGSRFRLYSNEGSNEAWIGIGSSNNKLKIGDADFGTPWATFFHGGNCTIAGALTAGDIDGSSVHTHSDTGNANGTATVTVGNGGMGIWAAQFGNGNNSQYKCGFWWSMNGNSSVQVHTSDTGVNGVSTNADITMSAADTTITATFGSLSGATGALKIISLGFN